MYRENTSISITSLEFGQARLKTCTRWLEIALTWVSTDKRLSYMYIKTSQMTYTSKDIYLCNKGETTNKASITTQQAPEYARLNTPIRQWEITPNLVSLHK